MTGIPRKWLTEADEYNEELLSADVRAVAKNELREDSCARRQALQQMRDWLRKNQRILNCRLDSNFLLRFLRAKKMSVVQAQEALERYLLLRECFADAFHNLDCKRPEIDHLISIGFIFVTPNRDHLGRRIIVTVPGKFDPYKYTNADMCRAHGVTYETLLENEEEQVRGVVHFVDGAGVSFPHLTLFTPREAVRIIKNGERTLPMRHKHIIGFNVNPALKFALDFGMGLVSEKIKQRITICSSVEESHNHIDKSLLPKEYGGEMPMAEMINLWKAELQQHRERLVSHDKMSVDLKLFSARAREGSVSALKQNNSPSCGPDTSTYSITGSFRKLEVD